MIRWGRKATGTATHCSRWAKYLVPGTPRNAGAKSRVSIGPRVGGRRRKLWHTGAVVLNGREIE